MGEPEKFMCVMWFHFERIMFTSLGSGANRRRASRIPQRVKTSEALERIWVPLLIYPISEAKRHGTMGKEGKITSPIPEASGVGTLS